MRQQYSFGHSEDNPFFACAKCHNLFLKEELSEENICKDCTLDFKKLEDNEIKIKN